MDIRRLDREKFSGVKALDPYGRIYLAYLPGYTALAVYPEKEPETEEPGAEAVETGGEAGAESEGSIAEESPVGLMIFGERKDGFTIEWIFIDENFRHKGIGEALLNVVYELSLAKKKHDIQAYFPEERAIGRKYFARAGYFDDHYFETEKPVPGEWNVSLMQLCEAEKARDSGSAPEGKLTRLSSLGSAQKLQLIECLRSKPNAEALFEFKNVEGCDLENSVVLVSDNSIKGAAVFCRTGEDLCLAGFFSDSKEISAALFSGFTSLAYENCDPAVRIRLLFRNDKNKELLAGLSREKYTPAKIMFGDAMIYYWSLEHDLEPTYSFTDAFEAMIEA